MPSNLWLITLTAIAALFVVAAVVVIALLFVSGRKDEREHRREE